MTNWFDHLRSDKQSICTCDVHYGQSQPVKLDWRQPLFDANCNTLSYLLEKVLVHGCHKQFAYGATSQLEKSQLTPSHTRDECTGWMHLEARHVHVKRTRDVVADFDRSL